MHIRAGGAVAPLVAMALLGQGCASPGVEVTQKVRVETPGCAPVSCELRNDRGSWRIARTPGEVEVTTSREALRVACRAEGEIELNASAASSLAPVTGGGAVVGGVTGGAAVGLAVGGVALAFIPVLGALVILTGIEGGALVGHAIESSQRAIGYPPLVSIPMACLGEAGASASTPGVAHFGVAFRGLTPEEARTAGLGGRGAALVTAVAGGSLAETAGLRSGDIVLAVDGHDIGDAADLQERVLALTPGNSLAIRVWRDGRAVELLTLYLPPSAP